MAIGPGKYGAECIDLLHKLNAEATILMVIHGERGDGFSVTSTIGPLHDLPRLLRYVADTVEKDLPNLTEGSA